MNIILKTSRYIDKKGLSNVYFDISATNYRKKIKSELYVRAVNSSKVEVEKSDVNYISKNILLQKLREKASQALENYDSEKWSLLDCEGFLSKGVEIISIKSFIHENFTHISIFTKNDYLNTIGVYSKHLGLNRTIYLKDLNEANLLLFKTNMLFSGLKLSSINSYIKKIKVLVNKAYSNNLLPNKNIFRNDLIEKENLKKINRGKNKFVNIEQGISNAESIYDLQAITLFVTMIIFKGMKPIDMVKYKEFDHSIMTNSKDKYIYYISRGIKRFVRFEENIFKLINILKTSMYYTHFERNTEVLAPYNNPYEVFNLDVSKEIKKHKNLWNIYQKKIKKLLGCNYKMANTLYVNYIDDLEISQNVRNILVGKNNGQEVVFDIENPLRNQINEVENRLIQDFKIGGLIALVENRMNLLGVLASESKNTNWQRPIDFIKTISSV